MFRVLSVKGSVVDLDGLLEALRSGDIELSDDLPLFGGKEPDSTLGVWSWDKDRLLVGETVRDLEIVDRGEWEEWLEDRN